MIIWTRCLVAIVATVFVNHSYCGGGTGQSAIIRDRESRGKGAAAGVDMCDLGSRTGLSVAKIPCIRDDGPIGIC